MRRPQKEFVKSNGRLCMCGAPATVVWRTYTVVVASLMYCSCDEAARGNERQLLELRMADDDVG